MIWMRISVWRIWIQSEHSEFKCLCWRTILSDFISLISIHNEDDSRQGNLIIHMIRDNELSRPPIASNSNLCFCIRRGKFSLVLEQNKFTDRIWCIAPLWWTVRNGCIACVCTQSRTGFRVFDCAWDSRSCIFYSHPSCSNHNIVLSGRSYNCYDSWRASWVDNWHRHWNGFKQTDISMA